MKMHKKVSVRGDFAKVGEDIRDGEVITINDAGTVISGEYGERTAFKIETRNGEKVLSFNQSSVNNLIEAYGEDSDQWIGKAAKAWIIKTMVSGKLRNVVYLAHPDWTMLDDGTFVPPKSAATQVEIDASEEAADEDYDAF
jgi:hypothetical protein